MSKKSVVIFAVTVTLAVIGGSIYWAMSGDDPQVPTPALNAATQNQHSNTVANNWQWKSSSDTQSTANLSEKLAVDKPRPTAKAPYDAAEIYKVLKSINLDGDGRLVPDQTALQALEQGFNNLGPDLSPEAMAGLQDVIRTGLPGQAGEEAAHILENYFRYRLAEQEFNQQLVTQLPANDHYTELTRLRRSYLGQEVADKLFAAENSQARYMIAAVAIQKNDNLSNEEKQAQQQALQEKLNDRLLASGQLKPEEVAAEEVQRLREQGASSADIYSTRKAILGVEGASELAAADREEAQWQSRFNGFWQARQYVMQAGLDDAERQRQIEQLLSQYFGPDEQERARTTSSQWQARDAT